MQGKWPIPDFSHLFRKKHGDVNKDLDELLESVSGGTDAGQ